MKSVYFENDDILKIRVSDKPVAQEISQDWNINISYAEDGSIVEIVFLNAKKEGLLPHEYIKAPMNEKKKRLYEFPPGDERIEVIKLLKNFPYRLRRSYFKRRFSEPNQHPKKYPSYLYKYASFIPSDKNSILYAKTIIVDSNLWLSSPLDFNDPFDCRTHFLTEKISVVQKERFNKLASILKNSNEEILDEKAVNSAENYATKRVAELILHNLGVTCFTKNPRNLLMWSHYAKHHTGICYQFEVVRDLAIFPRAVSVEYSKYYPSLQFFDMKPDEAAKAILSKFEDWQYEKEMRIVAVDGSRQLLSFRPKALTGIILGSCIDIESKKALDKIIQDRANNGLPSLKVFHAVQHSNKYKLSLRKAQLN